MTYTLYKFFGLQRSGNHAVLNWLIGLDHENTLFFNDVRPGECLTENPSGVSLPPGCKAYSTRENGKKIIHHDYLSSFKETGGRLIVSYENYPISNFNENSLNKPIFEEFGEPETSKNILILRNPFNMLPSAEKMLESIQQHKKKDEAWVKQTLETRLKLWRNYAFLHVHPDSITRGKFSSILFDRWVSDLSYRNLIAESLGYKNNDTFLNFVSDAGGGSSFTGENVSNTKSTLSRWQKNSRSALVIRKFPEVTDYASLIFGKDCIPTDYILENGHY